MQSICDRIDDPKERAEIDEYYSKMRCVGFNSPRPSDRAQPNTDQDLSSILAQFCEQNSEIKNNMFTNSRSVSSGRSAPMPATVNHTNSNISVILDADLNEPSSLNKNKSEQVVSPSIVVEGDPETEDSSIASEEADEASEFQFAAELESMSNDQMRNMLDVFERIDSDRRSSSETLEGEEDFQQKMAQFALAEQKHMAEMVEDLGAKDEDIFPVEIGRRPSSMDIGYGSDQEPEIPLERGISQILSSDDEFDPEMAEQNGSGGVISKLLRKLTRKKSTSASQSGVYVERHSNQSSDPGTPVTFMEMLNSEQDEEQLTFMEFMERGY